ncbi:tetratricopeptide repeat [Fusarium sp. NRRL 25303]|nr:tetratricopeptide repeat [Fusarium sp. NRRL 25303]
MEDPSATGTGGIGLKAAVGILCSVEDSYIHQGIQCDACEKSIVGVRFRCDQCEDFDFCSTCYEGTIRNQHDPSHAFYVIQYRRLALPSPDGEDLTMLQRFDHASTSESFYLHFPWFFSPTVVSQLIAGTNDQDKMQTVLEKLEETFHGTALHVALDGLVRQLARDAWNWRDVRDRVRPLLDLHLVRAEYTGLFNKMYLTIEHISTESEGDSSFSAVYLQALRKKLYTLTLTSASSESFQRAIQVFLEARSEVHIDTTHISESAKYVKKLSEGFDGQYLTDYPVETLGPRGHHARLFSDPIAYQIQPPKNASSPDSLMESLLQCTAVRDFSAAIQLAEDADLNPYHLLELVQVHETRGSLHDAHRIASSTSQRVHQLWQNQQAEPMLVMLFKLLEAYFGCYTRGQWINAMKLGQNALEELALKPNSSSTHLRITVELSCFKIFFLASKDRNERLNSQLLSTVAVRLRHLQRNAFALGAFDTALDILDTQMRVYQQENIIYELENVEYLPHRTILVPALQPAVAAFEEFRKLCRELPKGTMLAFDRGSAMEASACLLLAYFMGEHETDVADHEILTVLSQARELYTLCNSALGKAETMMLALRHGINLDVPEAEGWDDIEKCFRSQGYFKGLMSLFEFRATADLSSTPERSRDPSLHSTSPSLHGQLLIIAKEAGNEWLARLHQIRSMCSWIEGPTFIKLSESIFDLDEGFLSDQLFLEASRLLSQLYELNNNFAESAAFGLLHLRLANARHDAMLVDQATLLYFRCVGNMVPTLPEKDRIYEVASLVMSFDTLISRLCHHVLDKMKSSSCCISAWSLPVIPLLWPARLVEHVIDDDYVQSMSPQVILAVHRSLKLALDWLVSLPSEFHGLFLPDICKAVGAGAEMIANPILSLLSYDLGQSRHLGPGGPTAATLQLKIGRRLTSWIQYNRPDFDGLQEVAFVYLDSAMEFFWADGADLSSYKNGLESSLILARAHLREVQTQIETLDWGEASWGQGENPTDEQMANKKALLRHVEQGLSSVKRELTGNMTLRAKLAGLPAMQALENSRLFYFGDMEELYWNAMGLEMDQSRLTGDPWPLFKAIENWKAVSLRDAIFQRLEQSMRPSNLVAGGSETSGAEPAILSIVSGVSANGEPRGFDEDSIWRMAEMAEAQWGGMKGIIFVEWTRYYDTLFVVAFDGTRGVLRKRVVELDYHQIEDWVRDELGVSSLHEGRSRRKRLQVFTRLQVLKPIIEILQGFAKPGDLLVCSPSGILHAVPLQAIPFGPEDKPLIVSNPVIFSPGLSLLRTCIDRVDGAGVLDAIPTAAFTRLGRDDPEEEQRMYLTALNGLADERLQPVRRVGGREATRKSFLHQSDGARLLHYHGHIYLEAAQRRDRALQLEPTRGDNGLLSIMDIFDLRLDLAAVVVLLACASGEDDMAPNDDPLGFLSAFLYAGATSVVATRWPTQTEDARMFAAAFYSHVFATRRDGVVNLAHAVQAAVVKLWEHWDEDEPYHWAQFQLYGSWFAKV